MGKRVILTWLDYEGQVVEECNLVSEDDAVYITWSEGETVFVDNLTTRLMKTDFVIFEDDTGVFGLPPDQIVNIEVLS